jgi:hypothetical protein
MAYSKHSRASAAPWWRTVWPCWLALLFAGLAIVRLLPAGPERALVAAPILLCVPGALTLGALLAGRRPYGIWFGCLAAVLSMIWAAFASLALYVVKVPITAESTYWCLLLICGLLATVTQVRLVREQPDSAGAPAAGLRDRAGYPLASAAAGAALLAAGTYGYLHLPHPAPVGYTWIAWSGPRVEGIMPVRGSGVTMPFEIEHEEPAAATFRLTAAWTGSTQQYPLAKPLIVRIGPDKTVRGSLDIPPPPGACAYRIVVTLAELGPADPPTWSINADVRRQGKRPNECTS